MWDESHGIVAGHLGICSPSACKGVILRTDDGGRSWSTVYFGPQVFEVTTEGTSNAWALTPNSLLVSDNQGGTWTVLDRTGHDLSFPTAANGWAVSDVIPPVTAHLAQPLIRTNDGGQTWRRVPGPCPSQAATPSAVRFVDRRHGWVGCAGEPSAGRQLKAIYETLDGGASWGLRAITSLNTGPAGAGVLPGDGYLAGMFFDSGGHGWMWLQRGCMVATVDGGATWVDTAPDLCTGDTYAVFGAWFLDAARGFVLHRELGLARPLQLLVSDDGGATWSRVHSWRQNH
ncbi:MAG TPA: hypothetical protein VKA30_04210 [Actinomycetota bacterium]|nr:hypothetical protein [Actinomycetota bacterium]